MMNPPIRFALLLIMSAAASCGQKMTSADREGLPNVVVILTDDQGYSDLGCYGAQDIETPNIDRMASEGIRFTNFYVGQPVCSASRAALLTGCYPNRVGIQGALFPHAKVGLNPAEVTIAEICKTKGYATAMVGKWHLGDQAGLTPTHQGFDEYLGLPYSNDMWPGHPDNGNIRFPRLPLIEDDSVIEYLDEDQSMLTTRYTERAVDFIERNRDRPFFLYVAHSMPHVPLFVSDKFRGKSNAGLYGDVIAEIDWSVGEILAALERSGLDENTLVVFMSDNGPWLSYGKHGGSALSLREGKGTVFEGGVRVPFIARWPARIPAGAVQDKAAMAIDVLPTIAGLLQAKLPEKPIDGKDMWSLLANEPEARPSHEAFFFYYRSNELQGMRSGKWKLYFPHTYSSFAGLQGHDDGTPVKYTRAQIGLELYDLAVDPGEKNNVAAQFPAVVDSLQQMAAEFRSRLGDSLTGIQATEAREPARLGE